MLGDRAEAKVGYTVRFRLVRDQLRLVHDRFGTTGYWSAVRDNVGVGAALAVALAQPDVTLDSLHPGQRQELEQQLKQEARTDALTIRNAPVPRPHRRLPVHRSRPARKA